MKVLHVETGRNLYGGPQQVLWLVGGLAPHGVHSTLVCSAGSAIERAAAVQGMTTLALPCAGDLDLRFGLRLARHLEEQRPDLVHCHSRRGADLLGGRAAAWAGVPAIVSRRVDNPESAFLARFRYRPFRKIVAISGAVADALRAAGVPDERVVTIRSAVDTERLSRPPDTREFAEIVGARGGRLFIFCVAQLIPRKGHRFLLQAMATLRPKYPDLHLVVFGRGPLREELKALAGKLGIDEAVTFAGFREELDNYLACADILAHPALAEGLGVAALKAAAAGVPVVAFEAGGLPEAVVPGKTGLLVESGNVAALASAIATLIDDPELRKRFGANGRRRMQQAFTIGGMVDAHLSLYRSVIGQPA